MSAQAYLSGTDELAELKSAFMRYDPDGGGYIRSALVEDALRCVGRDPARAMMILREFDPDGAGPVDFEQFIRIAATAQGVYPLLAAEQPLAFNASPCAVYCGLGFSVPPRVSTRSLLCPRSLSTAPRFYRLPSLLLRSAPPRAPVPSVVASGAPIVPDLSATLMTSSPRSGAGANALAYSSAAVDALLEAPHPAFPGAGSESVGSDMSLSRLPPGYASDPLLREEGPDSKVEEFLRVLSDYRTKCEREGLYEEAGRASAQLDSMRKSEETRRTKAMRSRHAAGERDLTFAPCDALNSF